MGCITSNGKEVSRMTKEKKPAKYVAREEERRLVKYIGNYEGTIKGKSFKPGEVKEVSLEDAEYLMETGQFELVQEVNK